MSPRWDDAVRVRSWFSNARGSMLQCEFVSERAGNSAGVLCGLSCLLSQEKQARPWSDHGPGQTTPSFFSGRMKKPNRFETSSNNNSRQKLERTQASCQTHTCCSPSTQHSNLFPGGAGNIRWSQEVARVTFLGSRM